MMFRLVENSNKMRILLENLYRRFKSCRPDHPLFTGFLLEKRESYNT